MSKTEQDFFGIYREVLIRYIHYKRALGFLVNEREIHGLLELNTFLCSYNVSQVLLTQKMVEDYVSRKKSVTAKTIHKDECRIRQVGIFLQNQGYSDIYIYPNNQLRTTSTFIPYIFTADEITRILYTADNLQPVPNKPYYQDFFKTILRVLYCTGLRVNEALSLKIEDVDFDNKLFIVENGKGDVSRLVPFNEILKEWLEKYHSKVTRKQDVYFFESPYGGKRSRGAVNYYFQRVILPSAGIHRKPDNSGPRIHDLRHTFACHALDKMVRSGMDPFCALPYLSTYMGHKGIESTEKYLRLTADHFSAIAEAGHYIYLESVGNSNE